MVVDYSNTAELDLRFRALADPTRRDIVMHVLRDERSVSDIAAGYAMSFAAVQKHVAVLERAGLVEKRRCGREQLVRGRIEALREVHRALDGLELLWRERIARVDSILEPDEDEGETSCP
ncbi:MAG: metalloregulator ArsR/SmtB family transcription factor [Gaiellales bacterium]